ncbi:uncharacterized protein LOC133203105 [Saccostrea echinata]|uniref:uncharacterized protein LOC133203105 n=1 Tax=Saccostrea echinata TaxID=191078 RepID=UPI002A7EE784|nr:uncharacterized protein LOC133203105 [Saccostrea echinata]
MTSTLSTTRHTLSTTKPTLISAIPNSSINLNLSTIRHTLSATKPTSILTTPTPFTTTPTSSTPTSSLTTPISYTTPILSTTTPSTTASPSNSSSCYLCNGMPIYICEQFSTPLQCEHDDQQFCLNILVNNRDGSRTLDRRCVNEQECQQEWWEKTSDRPECSGYDPASYTPKYFTCSYCCTTPLCNKNIVPKDLYVPTKK